MNLAVDRGHIGKGDAVASIDDREPLPNPMVDAMVLPQEEG
jgi:hypothetical protein